jgi:hypothetical protein
MKKHQAKYVYSTVASKNAFRKAFRLITGEYPWNAVGDAIFEDSASEMRKIHADKFCSFLTEWRDALRKTDLED